MTVGCSASGGRTWISEQRIPLAHQQFASAAAARQHIQAAIDVALVSSALLRFDGDQLADWREILDDTGFVDQTKTQYRLIGGADLTVGRRLAPT